MSVLSPQSEAELADVVSDAHATSTPLRIVGGNTRNNLGGRSTAATELSTQSLSGVSLYEPGALTLIAQAGTPLSEIQAVLKSENQILPFEPMDHRTVLGSSGEPTIGAVASEVGTEAAPAASSEGVDEESAEEQVEEVAELEEGNGVAPEAAPAGADEEAASPLAEGDEGDIRDNGGPS